MKSKTFDHDGNHYEIRPTMTSNGWTVYIFMNGVLFVSLTYSVSYENIQDAVLSLQENLVVGLMEAAEHDIRRGLVQELMAAARATDENIAAEINEFKL